jgi:hypothetical protein
MLVFVVSLGVGVGGGGGGGLCSTDGPWTRAPVSMPCGHAVVGGGGWCR